MLGLPNWRSLQTRIAAGMLVVAPGIPWATEYAQSHSLCRDMEAAISAQQYSTVSLIAKEIDRSILDSPARHRNVERRRARHGTDRNP